MKKLITCIISFLILTSVISAETIGKRIFEIKMDIEAAASNNAFGISDFFQEETIIDLPKIYKDLPKKGFITSFNTDPDFSLSLNILGLKAGVDLGVDVSGSVNLSKDMFKLLGEGNKLNEPMEFTGGGKLDAFAYFKVPVNLKVKGITISAAPAVFVPVVHAEIVNTGVTVTNTDTGAITVDGTYAVLIQSALEADSIETRQIPTKPGDWLGTSGLDLALGVKVPLFMGLQVTGDVQVPLVPGKLASEAETHGGFSYAMNLLNKEDNKPFEFEKNDVKYESVTETINRPLTLMAGAEWSPVLDMVHLNGSIGWGIRYPFSKRAYFYPQYYAGARVSLLRIIGASFSTEYINEMYKHEASMMFNIRALEFDVGVSLTGADMKNSLSGKGFGAYITFCLGF